MKTIICVLFFLLMANSYGAVGIPVQEQEELYLNECGETREEFFDRNGVCADLNYPGCPEGSIAYSSHNLISCRIDSVEGFLNEYELDE